MPLMGSLYIGTSGLQASSNALNTTANNLANVDTKGYTRQQVVMGNAILNTVERTKAIGPTQIGLGVNVDEVRRVRDVFMDTSYRTEVGRQAFYQVTYEALEEMQVLFGEMEGVAVQEALRDLWNSMSEVAKSPNDATYLALLRDKASAFITRCNSVSQGLRSYQEKVNTKVTQSVDRINELAENIYNLNLNICKIEGGGIENANDLRDLRDEMLDELGQLINISYKEDENGMVTVRAEGKEFIMKGCYFKMKAEVDSKTGLATPIWPHLNNEEVFNFTVPISTALNTDIGQLKAYVIARGNKTANFMDMPVRPKAEDFEDGTADPIYQAVTQLYDRFNAGENFSRPNPASYPGGESDPVYQAVLEAYEDLTHYENYTSVSVINNIQAEFDQMFHSICTMINDVLCPNKEITLADGTTVKVLDEENMSYGAAGEIGQELFSRNGYSRYKIETLTPVGGVPTQFYVYQEEEEGSTNTQYTLGNVSINPSVMQDASVLPMNVRNAGAVDADYKRAAEMLDRWAQPFARLNPYSSAEVDYQTYYRQMIGEIANLGSVYKNVAIDLDKAVTYIDNQRQEVAGVSSDEELTNTIRYQNAYNAASRYITVINEMLGHLISQLGTR